MGKGLPDDTLFCETTPVLWMTGPASTFKIRRSMKKLLKLVLLFTLIAPPLYALPAGSVSVPASAPDPNRIGIVAAVRGSVKIETSAKVGRDVKSGTSVYLGDTVSTDEKGNLQIMLMDQTVFTIGPNSAIVIDKFIYDPATQDGQVNAKVVKGIFRFVTGKIGQKNPDSMKVDLPAGTIGIRGTIVAGQSQGQRSTVVLLGPGEKNNTSSRRGSITVGNTVNGQVKSVLINRSGFGTVIEGGEGAPSSPFKIPAEMLQGITSALGSTSEADAEDSDADSDTGSADGENSESSDSATEQAGQDTAEAEISVDDANADTAVFGELDLVSQNASQSSVEEQEGIFDGISTFNDLQRVPGGGQFKYEQSSVSLYNTANTTSAIGSYHILVNMTVDFGSRAVVGGPNSTVDGSLNGHAFAFAISTLSSGAGDDFAVFSLDSTNTSNSAHPDLEIEGTLLFLNSGGDPATAMVHAVEITDNTSGGPFPSGEGAGVTARQSV